MSENGNAINNALINVLRSDEENNYQIPTQIPEKASSTKTLGRISKPTNNVKPAGQSSIFGSLAAAVQSSGSSDSLNMPGHRPRQRSSGKTEKKKKTYSK